MDDLGKRLDKLRELLQDPNFLKDVGLSNEVNIRVFRYDPKDEATVCFFLDRLPADGNFKTRLVVFNLYELFLEICEDLDIVEGVEQAEAKYGSDYALENLRTAIGVDEYIDKMREKADPKDGDVVILTGVGDVFPFMRVHKILEAMQPRFSDVPILVMYPGEYDGTSLKLFNLLEPSPYYRAFNVL